MGYLHPIMLCSKLLARVELRYHNSLIINIVYDTCIDLSFDKLNNDFQSAFLNVAETPIYDYAKVMYQVENSVGEISYDISVRCKVIHPKY